MPSAALSLPGNADGDARVNSICDPLQGSETIGDVKPFGDIQAFTPKEAISAFDTTAVQLALLAAPDAQPLSVQDSLAVGPSCSAEIDQMADAGLFHHSRCVLRCVTLQGRCCGRCVPVRLRSASCELLLAGVELV